MPAARVEAHRRDLVALTALAGDDVRVAWRGFTTADSARDGLAAMLPRLAQVYGAAAATLAADWYDDLRADLGLPGRFRAIPAALPDDLGTDALAGWGTGPLFSDEPDVSAAQSLILGGMQRRIMNSDRDTLTISSVADPAATGWQRVGGGSCEFCAMLIGRGVVYSQASADFASHDHCHCTAAPAFQGQPRPVRPFTPSLRDSTPADRARVREYIATH